MAYYAVAYQKDAPAVFELMTAAEVDAHKLRFCPYWQSTPWKTDFDAMAIKTVIHKLAKRLPLAVELSQQVAREEAMDLGNAPVVAHSELLEDEQDAGAEG